MNATSETVRVCSRAERRCRDVEVTRTSFVSFTPADPDDMFINTRHRRHQTNGIKGPRLLDGRMLDATVRAL